ncbi:hypothetical protein Hanom_Chr13g01223871 [Helianthus anomalus]
MYHVVVLIAERLKNTCTNQFLSPIIDCYVSYVQGLMQNYNRAGSLTKSTLSISMGRGKVVYTLSSSDHTLVLLLMRFTKYDDVI